MKSNDASKPSKRFYVYALADIDVVFYVGKGTKGRMAQHETEADRGYGQGRTKQYICHCRKCIIIRNIWDARRDVIRIVLFETDDEQRAYDYERAAIAKYTSPHLCNVMHGTARRTRRQKTQEQMIAPELRTANYEAEQSKEEHGRRTSGSGAVYQIGGGRWCASVRYTHPDTGKPWRKKFEGKTRDIVVAKMFAFMEENKVK